MNSALHKAIAKTPDTPFLERSEAIDQAIAGAVNHVAKYAKGSGIETINLLMIGGASLHLNGFRGKFSDIDFLIENIELSTRMDQQLFKCPNSGLSVELFYDNKISTVNDSAMFSRGIAVDSFSQDGIKINVSCYPSEYFLLMKMEMGREKCQKDIQSMLQNIPLPRLASAFNDLAGCNEKWVMNDIADMIITDLLMLNMPGTLQGDSLAPLKEFCAELSIEPEKKKDLMIMCKHIELQSKKRMPRVAIEASCSM
jgi:hypothetical protein